MSEAPERIWMDPDIRFPECEKQYGCDIGYVRLDLYEELEAKLAKPRSLCQGKYLACRIEELEAKLAKATEALGRIVRGDDDADNWAIHKFACRWTLAELKGDKE